MAVGTTDGFVYVEASESLNGVLRYQSFSPLPMLDQWDTLQRVKDLPEFDRQVRSAGLAYSFSGDAEEHHRFLMEMVESPFTCSSPWLDEHELWEFQRIGMNFCQRIPRMLIQWDTGGGKTVCGTLTAQKLIDDDRIDAVIVLCRKSKTVDWERFFQKWSTLDASRVPSFPKRERRMQWYETFEGQVLVANYEKLRAPRKDEHGKEMWDTTDLRQLQNLFRGKRLLVIFDEPHAVGLGRISTATHRGIRRFFTQVSKRGDVRLLELTATPLTKNPYNVHSLFKLIEPRALGTKEEFEREYVLEWTDTNLPVWNETRFGLLGKRISPWTSIAMKSDPDIAKQFPAMVEREVSIELSDEDRSIYDHVVGRSRSDFDTNDSTLNFSNFQLLRMLCNTPEALVTSTSKMAHRLVENFDVHRVSAKFQALSDLLSAIVAEGDKAVVFSFWLDGTIFPLQRFLAGGPSTPIKNARARSDAYTKQLPRPKFRTRKGSQGSNQPEIKKGSLTLIAKQSEKGGRSQGVLDCPVMTYVGRSMSETRRAEVVDRFNEIEGPAVLLTSDAGQEGLNLYAPYVISVETPYTYASYRQRRDRIHRGDSLAHGIDTCWSYRFITNDTVEERVADLVSMRKRQSELVQGVPDIEAKTESFDQKTLRWLMFGE